jgi:hypothetical protein
MYTTLRYCGMDENGKWSMSQGWKSVKTDILTNEIARRNLRRLARDIIVSLLLTVLFRVWLKRKY